MELSSDRLLTAISDPSIAQQLVCRRFRDQSLWPLNNVRWPPASHERNDSRRSALIFGPSFPMCGPSEGFCALDSR
jgi:hypothetical protein